MTTPRRRILRPHRPELPARPRDETRQERQRQKLTKHRLSLKRWLTRLKRSANTVADLHQQIAKLETQLAGR